MLTLEGIARTLGGEISGGQVLAPGPGHSAKDRSLSIKLGTKSEPIVYSHAGDDHLRCKDYVKEKLGLSPRNGKAGQRKITATYDYVDELGCLLFQVVRFDPKDFRQRRPDGDGWKWKLGDTRRVLYRLPETLEAVATEKPIFIAEGEKGVDELAKIGVSATCSPGGAGKCTSAITRITSRARLSSSCRITTDQARDTPPK
jgi:hypothetical protein